MNIYPILYEKHDIITEEERMTGKGSYNMGSISIRVQPDSKTSSRYVKVKVKAAQSFMTLFDPMGYTVHGILQARILEG